MSEDPIFTALEWAKDKKMNQSDLARVLGVSPQDITNWKKRGMPLDKLQAVADVFGKSVDELLGRQLREPAVIYNVEPAPRMAAPVPLISWVQAGDWCGVIDNFAPGDAEEWLPCPRSHGPHTFALRVRGVSMEPKYRDGSIIFVDPDKHADHGSNIVVRMEDDKEATFKQLVVEGDKRFLKPLNPNWPEQLIPINEHATICGVVIGQFIPE